MPLDHIGRRTIPALLAERIGQDPDKAALVFESRTGTVRRYSYRELGDAVACVAGGLAALGVGRSDKVVLHLGNCPEFAITLLALAHLGAVGVPSNTANRVGELTHVVGWSDASHVVTSTEFLDTVTEVIGRTACVRNLIIVDAHADTGAESGDRSRSSPWVSFATLMLSEPAGPPARIDSEDPIEIIFTSGTTSLPKGVVLTHANWLWSGERSTHWLRVGKDDRLLTALPLFHVNARSFTWLPSLTVGATAVFIEQYSASRFMEQIRRHQATHMSLVAMQLRTLLSQPESELDRSHGLRCVNFAINVSSDEKEAFEQRFGVELLNGYGLSEAITEVTVCPISREKRWPSIGLPAFGREVRIVDRTGAEVPPGEVGEITVRGVPGRTIMKEYYKDPEATAMTIVDGWLRTGDNGYADESGYLYFFDRSKDVIKRAGENVSASEVEVILTGHPEVAMAAVIGVPDPVRDEAVVAFVVPCADTSPTEEDILRHCREHLANFKVPSVIEFRDSLPLTSIGKIEKRQLRVSARDPRPL